MNGLSPKSYILSLVVIGGETFVIFERKRSGTLATERVHTGSGPVIDNADFSTSY